MWHKRKRSEREKKKNFDGMFQLLVFFVNNNNLLENK